MSSTVDKYSLRAAILAVLADRPKESAVNTLAKMAFQFSSVRLRQLMHSGRLHLQSFQLPLEGVAFDCIAELFQRNEDGAFIELREYFCRGNDLGLLTEDETEQRFRGLVFSKLQHGLVRLYKENDPVLHKILRNLRIAVQKQIQFELFERLGQQYISFAPLETRNDHLPEFPLEELEQALMEMDSRIDFTDTYLKLFGDALVNQNRYRRFYRLIDIAVLFKRIMSRKELRLNAAVPADDTLLEQDLYSLLTNAADTLRQRFYQQYVEKEKISAALFDQYWSALHEMILDAFARNDGSDLSQADYLIRHIPGLTQEEYRIRHRTHFEYMSRVTFGFVKKELRELL